MLISILLLASCSPIPSDNNDDIGDGDYDIVIESISINSTTLKNKFTVGEELPTGIKLNVFYSDGTTSEVNVTDSMISGFSTTQPGNIVLFIEYSGKSTIYQIEVLDTEVPTVYLTSLELDSTTISNEYNVHDTFPLGVKLNATYSNNTTGTIDVTEEMVRGFDTSTFGQKNVLFIYENREIRFTIYVYDLNQIENIRLDKNQFKSAYSVDESIDLNSIYLELVSSSQNSRFVKLTYEMIDRSFNTKIAGNIPMRVNYLNLSTEIILNVVGTFTLNDFIITFDTEKETYNILEYIGNSEDVVIPGLINNCKIGYIAPCIFADHIDNIKNLTIPFIGPTANNDNYKESFSYLYLNLDDEPPVNSHNYNAQLTLTILPYYSSSIYPNSFANDIKTSKLILPEGILEIGRSAFAFSSIKEFDLPDSLKIIRQAAFESTLAQYIKIPDNIESIEIYAFFNMFYIIDLPLTPIINIAEDAFHDTLVYFVIDDASYQTYVNDNYFKKYSNNFIRQSEFQIYDESFYVVGSKVLAYSGIEEIVTIPTFITEIGTYSFYNKAFITEIILPDNLISIGAYAFSETRFREIILPEKVEEIGDCAFNSYINTLILPSSIKTLGVSVFNGWKIIFESSTPITLNNSINVHFIIVPNNAVYEYRYQWSDKTDIIYSMSDFDNEFTIVNGVLINYNGNGGDVTIPNNVECIGEYVFSYDIGGGLNYSTRVTSITLSDRLRIISAFAFYKNDYLISVTIEGHSWLEIIGDSAFFSCRNLKEFKIRDNIQLISIREMAFYNCNNLTEFTWVDSIRTIGYGAFSQTGIRNVVFSIGSQLALIDRNAFGNSNLELVVLPSSINKIYEYAFSNNPRLHVINMRSESDHNISLDENWNTTGNIKYEVVWSYMD
jgi:hypothetical protein